MFAQIHEELEQIGLDEEIENNNNINANLMHSYYVKHAYTENTMTCILSKELSITEFICEVQFQASRSFNISIFREHLFSKIEVVEAGQEISGVNSEDAPKMQPNDDITMEEKYGDKLKNMAFYIRYQIPENQNPNANVATTTGQR